MRPVGEVQVDVVQAHVPQGLVEAEFHVLWRREMRPEFGGDEELGSGDPGLADRLPDFCVDLEQRTRSVSLVLSKSPVAG